VKREYVVTVPAAEAARLRAFDNRASGTKHWPLGPNRSFWRRNRSTFVVKEYAGSILSGAVVMTLGKATLLEGGDQVHVTVRTKGHAYGYLLMSCGVVAALLTPRDGLPALLLGVLLLVAGWFLFVRRPGMGDDLDDVEKVLRAKIRGHWQPADEAPDTAYTGPPRTEFEAANRLTNFLHGDDLDNRPAHPAGWSVTDLLPARTVLDDGTLRVRRRGRVLATIPADTVGSFAQIPWRPDLVNEFPAVEAWVVSNDGQPLAVVGWDTRIERQVRDAGLLVRRFAHSIDRDVIPHVWPERPTRPVAVHVDPAARR
jgi:hypothetical protein